MFCVNCGKELPDGARFCHGCGSTVEPIETLMGEDWSSESGNGRGPAQKKRSWIWIPIVAVVAVAAVVAVVLAGAMGGDSARLLKAAAKSGQAYSAAAEKLELSELSSLAEQKACSGELSVWLEDMEGYSEMSGLGVRVDMDADMPKREIGMSVTPYFGSINLLTAQMKLDDGEMYIGVEELTGDTFYMIDTETMGQDLNNLGAGVEELAAFGFNVFDIAERLEEFNAQNEQVGEELQAAFLEFAGTIEVEKTGTETLEVNGSESKCTVYHVILREDALDTLVDALEAAYSAMDTTEVYLDIMRSVGLPEEAMEELEYSLAAAGAESGDMFGSIREVLAELGDIELDVGVNDGYIVSVVYNGSIQGSEMEIILNLGGGGNYADDICLRMIVDGSELRITSTGNHSGSGGKFTDVTTVDMIEYYAEYTVARMELSYEPKANDDNFSWKLETEDVSVDIQGQVSAGGDALKLKLDEISISEYGYDVITLGLKYEIGKHDGDSIDTANVKALGEMTQEDLMNEAMALQQNATGWLQELINYFPELSYYFY